MSSLSRAVTQLRQVNRALERERANVLDALNVATLEQQFLISAQRVAPRGDHDGAHSADRLTVVRRVVGRNHIEIELFGPLVQKYQITGTKAHWIPKGSLPYPLRFLWNGQLTFAKYVDHPGQGPNDWRPRAVALMRPLVEALATEGAMFWRRKLITEMGV